MFDAPQSRPLKLTAYPFKLKENEILKKDFQNTTHLKICRKKRIKQNKRLVTRDIQFELVFKMKCISCSPLRTTYAIFSIDWLLGVLPNLRCFLKSRL